MKRKTALAAWTKASGAPNEAQLRAINAYTLTALTADQVYVRTAWLAHNGIDRDGEVFDDALLEDFARTIVGKGLFVRHPGGWDGDSGPGVGRWFAAQVVSMSLEAAREALRQPNLKFPPSTTEAKLLEASFYIPRTKNADLIADIDAGVAGDVSIGFRAADRTAVQDAFGNTIAARLLGPGEALEGSLVWLGAQPGARVVKHARPDDPAEDNMTLRAENKKLKAEIARLKRSNEALEQKLERLLDKLIERSGYSTGLGEPPAAPRFAIDDPTTNPLKNPLIADVPYAWPSQPLTVEALAKLKADEAYEKSLRFLMEREEALRKADEEAARKAEEAREVLAARNASTLLNNPLIGAPGARAHDVFLADETKPAGWSDGA